MQGVGGDRGTSLIVIEDGDTFTVFYDPDNPGRHKVLTIWGLFMPLLALCIGAWLSLTGFRNSKWLFPVWVFAWNHNRKENLEERYGTVITLSAEQVVKTMAKSINPVQLDWLHGFSGGQARNLSVWFVFNTIEEYEQAVASGLAGKIEATMRDELRKNGYPADSIQAVSLRFKMRESTMA